MMRELVEFSLTVVMCGILLCMIIGWMICHLEWMLTIEPVVVLLLEV